MMPPADRIHEQNEPDPGRVVHTRQEAGSNDFLAVGPALHILQLNVEGLSAAKYSIIRDTAERHNVKSAPQSHMAGIYSDCSIREIINNMHPGFCACPGACSWLACCALLVLLCYCSCAFLLLILIFFPVVYIPFMCPVCFSVYVCACDLSSLGPTRGALNAA